MMKDDDFYAMQKLAITSSDGRFPKAFWDEVIRREGKIDPDKYGVGCSENRNSPAASLEGKKVYRRIFIRLRTPIETLTLRPIKDGKDFAERAAIIENWFYSISRERNFVLTFEASEVSDEEADLMQKGGAE